jgi:hypothetical protein
MAKKKIRMLILWKKTRHQFIDCWIDAHICDKCIEQAHGIVEEIEINGKFKIS